MRGFLGDLFKGRAALYKCTFLATPSAYHYRSHQVQALSDLDNASTPSQYIYRKRVVRIVGACDRWWAAKPGQNGRRRSRSLISRQGPKSIGSQEFKKWMISESIGRQMGRWMAYLTSEQLSINAHQKGIHLAISSQQIHPNLGQFIYYCLNYSVLPDCHCPYRRQSACS